MRLALVFLFLSVTVLHAQSTCEIWQWTGTDSLNKKVVRTETYDARGLLIAETFDGMNDGLFAPVDGTYTYEYSDTLLTKQTFGSATGDSMRIEFQYDPTGLRLSDKAYVRKASTADTVQSGMYTIVNVSTDTTEEKWVQRGTTTYSYDRWGRKIAVITDNGSVYAQRWEYDEKGRIATRSSYSGNRKNWEESYVYFEGGYKYTRTWRNAKGRKIRKSKNNLYEYMLPTTFIYKLDTQGRIISEQRLDHNGKQMYRTEMFYNSEGKQTRQVFRGENDEVKVVSEWVWG